MSMNPIQASSFVVAAGQAGQTVAALLRQWLPGQSWSQVRKLIAARRVKINGELWLDDARRLKDGDVVDVLARPEKKVDLTDQLVLRHVDEHVVVVEKPSGISTVRHPSERQWSGERRALAPTLDDLVLHQLGQSPYGGGPGRKTRLRIVHRLDKETSGLVVFARTVEAERGLGLQFARHTVLRRYLALVPGRLENRTVRSFLVRDRGDGRRGSSKVEGGKAQGSKGDGEGKEAITHFQVEEAFAGFTLLSCRLETGRTHQIRIHLAELGHPVCGEKVYGPRLGEKPAPDQSGSPRLFLHAIKLGFQHPVT